MSYGNDSVFDDELERSRQDGAVVAYGNSPHSTSTSRGGKQDVAAALLRMDRFADRLASIRSNIAARASGSMSTAPPRHLPFEQREESGLPSTRLLVAYTSSAVSSTSSHALEPQSLEHIKLPLLQLIASNNESASRPADPFLSIDAVQQRAALQQTYTSDAERLADAEQVAADALQNADRLAEDSRIAMVLYTQNERSWSFDERAIRYQKVVETRKLAEVARVHADDDRAAAQILRSRLVNPYGALQSMSRKRSHRKRGVHHVSPHVAGTERQAENEAGAASSSSAAVDDSSQAKDVVYIWLLAAPSTSLSFTPRESTVSSVLAAEKELSTHVVYYAAASTLTVERNSDEKSTRSPESSHSTLQQAQLVANDSPPPTGWISCSSHGVAPVPEVSSVKSSLETWMVSGAGVSHLNGKYILSGVHDGVRKFKSSTGVELFRKRISVASSLAQGLHDAPAATLITRDVETPDTAVLDRNRDQVTDGNDSVSVATLPSALKAVEGEESTFQSMSRVGSWLGSNEMREKHRRRRESEARIQSDDANADPERNERAPIDGDHVMTQDATMRLESSMNLQASRLEANAPLCREWVLFMNCSRRHEASVAAGTSAPPTQKSGLGCLKRHYYISVEEKATMTVWAQEKEARLEQSVLHCIIQREELMSRVRRLCTKCMVKFQQNLVRDTDKIALKVIAELNVMRFLSVKVLEAIEKWRAHARKLGFARFDAHRLSDSGLECHDKAHAELTASTKPETVTSASAGEPALLGWSASITLATGRQLYKGSNAFVSRVKRFCRAGDAVGKKEQHIVYLGYFPTRMEAERAYEEHAAAEARRLNTTVVHLPRHRNVFRSCGKHFAVESERAGPSVCIECKVKQLASLSTGAGADDWVPPFFYTPEENYVLKMGTDLDFLDDVPPVTALLNAGHGSHDPVFPILGNVFLLPKTPIQDPILAEFASCGLARAPRLGVALEAEKEEITDETLGRDRILAVQKVFLQELQMYRPELFPANSLKLLPRLTGPASKLGEGRVQTAVSDTDTLEADYRIVEALYWDRCAALRIQQKRAPLAFRQQNTWCRPDAGEWTSLAVRGKHQLHFQFELKLAAAGKETQEKRKLVVKALRRLLKTPLYWIPSRELFTRVIHDGVAIKGDVVMLEVKSASKYLDKYDSWCAKTRAIQRWYRGLRGRQRASTRQAALRFACQFRLRVALQVASVARAFYEDLVVPSAARRAVRAIAKPEFTAALKLDGEFVVVSFHSLRHYNAVVQPVARQAKSPLSTALERSRCCAACARRFHVRAAYNLAANRFEVTDGGVCCCSLNGGWCSDRHTRETSDASENWLVRAYNPISNTTYRMTVKNALIRQLLSLLQPIHLGKLVIPSLESAATTPDQDEPVAFKWSTHERAVVASVQANFWQAQCAKAHQEVENWRLLSTEATQRRKTAMIRRDRTATALKSLRQSYNLSIGSAKTALDFASRQFHEAQAWDPLENANDWKLLVRKRQLQKELEVTESELDRCRLEVFRSTYDEQYLQARCGQVQERYERDWLPLARRESRKLQTASTLESAAKSHVECSLRQICHRFLTLRDTCFLPTRRHLVLLSSEWKTKCSGTHVAVPGLLRTRNVLRTRVLLLSNDEKSPTHRRCERMIVSVSMSASPLANRTGRSSDMWVSAYDPASGRVQEVFLEWELVELLVGIQSCSRRTNKKSKAAIGALRHDQQRSEMLGIADHLLANAMLDRFTGEFTLRKLLFYHHVRLLRSQFLSCKWFADVTRGRKSGAGDEVLRQAACVDGRLVVAVVFENWGDLTFALYHAASGESYRVTVTLSETFTLLRTKPLMLQLWVCCVKGNTYNPSLLMFILKHVRFRADNSDSSSSESSCVAVSVFEPRLPSASARKRFQKAMTVQSRHVLLSIAEDAGGDFEVTAFDWKQNETYKLVLELEQVRRLLRRSVSSVTEPHPSAASPSLTTAARDAITSQRSSVRQLLLQKNRRKLFEWIASRLTFQSLLEHPQLLAAAHSPLSFGVHLRQSVRVFNQWIASSTRNPLQLVSGVTVSRWASEVDAAAFTQLQFDQLAVIAGGVVPLAYAMDYVGALDWGPSEHAAAPTSSMMKMECFVKSHNLFLRLRRELLVETERRQASASLSAMELEEKRSLWTETLNALEDASLLFTHWQTRLERTKVFVDDRWSVVRQLHRELSARWELETSSVAVELTRAVTSLAHRLLYSEDDNGSERLVLHTMFKRPETASEVEFAAAVVNESTGSLRIASQVLTSCSELVGTALRPSLAALRTHVHEAAKRPSMAIETQKRIWRQVLRFMSNAVPSDFTDFVSDSVVPTLQSVSAAWNAPVAASGALLEGEPSLKPLVRCVDEPDDGSLKTAVLIPSDCEEPVQEIFIDGTADLESLAGHFNQLTKNASVERDARQHKATCEPRAVRTKAVHGGILAFQVVCLQERDAEVGELSTLRPNPRARSIAAESGDVVGDALFFATSTSGHSLLDRHARITAVAHELAVVSLDSSLANSTTHATRRNQQRNRVKQQLSWKVYASERLQAARSLKRTRAVDHVALAQTDSTTESLALTTLVLPFRDLELLFGSAALSLTGLHTLLPRVLSSVVAVGRDENAVDGSSGGWTLRTTRPLRMRNALTVESGSSSSAVALLNPAGGLRTEHLQVELDSLEHPKRLIFSCRELQSQRKYYADCSLHQLQELLRLKDPKTAVDSGAVGGRGDDKHELSIADWRWLAQRAAPLLVFRKKNGVLGLDIRVPATATATISTDINDSDRRRDATSIVNSQVDTTRSLEADVETELDSVLLGCLRRRLEKHQIEIRATSCKGMLATHRARHEACQLPREWMRMAKEDLLSRECRGLLVLDVKELRKLQSALTAATKRVTSVPSPPPATSEAAGHIDKDHRPNAQLLLLLEVAKELGLGGDCGTAVGEMAHAILTTRQTRELRKPTNPDTSAKAPPRTVRSTRLAAPVCLSEIAEWWRKHQCQEARS